MKYNKIVEGTFLERPNRFIAKVLVDGKEESSCEKYRQMSGTFNQRS